MIKKTTDTELAITSDYRQFIEDLKERVVSARVSAARKVNHELILLYWDIGRAIVEKQQVLGWGDSVVELVSADLQRTFPSMSGFSPRNVWDMRRLYDVYSSPDFLSHVVREINKHGTGSIDDPCAFLQQLVAEIPWGQNLLILNKLSDPAARLWYLRATAQFGWSPTYFVASRWSRPGAVVCR